MDKPGQGAPEQAEKRRWRQRIERKPEAKDAANNHGVELASRNGGGIRTAAIWRSADAKRGGNDGQSNLTFDAGMLFEGGTVEAQTQVLQRLDGTQRQKAIQRIARVQGNQHVQRVVAAYGGNGRGRVSPTAQTKLEVGRPDDAYEKEADAVAEQVMRMPAPAPPPPAGGTSSSEEQGGQGTPKHPHLPTISRLSIPVSSPRPAGDGLVARAEEVESYEEEEEPDEAERLSTAAGGDGGDNGAGKPGVPTVDAGLEGRIAQLKGSGSPLPPSDREFFESRFGVDFGDVRVHTGDTAVQTARDLSARAYTVGSDIAFGAGEYAPGTEHGRRLLAHELTHVVQQGGAGSLQREPGDTIRRSEEEAAGGGGEAAEPPVPAAGSGPAEPAGAGEGGAPQPGGNGAGPRGAATPAAPAALDKSAGDNGTGAKAAEALAGSRAPASPGQDPGFRAVAGRVGAVADRERTHEEPETEAEEAQEAAESPTNELEGKAQDQQVQEMEQQKPGEFSAAAFKAALLAKIKEITPKKLKDVDEFKKKNRISSVRDSVKQKVAEQKARSMGTLEEKVEETPDTSGIEPKTVTPMDQPAVGPAPGDIGAGEAAPKPKKRDEIEDPLLRESASLDQDLERAGITEEQLAESNEPQFLATLKAKKDAQAYVAESLPAYRKDEGQIVAGAQQEAQTAVVGPLEGMHGSREELLAAVFSEQHDTKADDEGKRGEVATAINQIYETTKKDIVGILDPLSDEVEKRFDTAAEKARRLFEDHVDREMKAYKKKRYGGLFGKLKWLKDKLLGMPKEVNRFYEDGRQLYIDTMDGEIDGIAAHVATELNKAMARIAQGRQEITEYVESLPEELQQIGTDAANEIQTKFDDLEQDVRDKQTELIDTLASKYQENLQELDARIEELKAANRGLIAKAIDFVKNVIATVTQLAALLARILLKAASAIPQILLHPIRFLKNLLQGVKQGLRNFVKNIGQHLQSAVLEWLTGATGLQLPATLDAKGLFSLVLQVLGLTYANIRERAVNIFGEKTVAYLEKGFEVFKILVTEGPAGLWEYIKDKVGDLKAMIIDRIKDLIKTKIIKAGIDWIVSMLGGPAGAFIKAVKAIIKVVKWFLENAKKIMALIDAVLDSILAIASGSVGEAANKVEQALAKQIPVVISFLADLVGVGDLSGSVRKIITEVRKPINSAIDWVLKKVKEFVVKMGHKLGIGEEETKEDKQERLQEALGKARDAMNTEFLREKQAGQDNLENGANRTEIDSKLGQTLANIKQDYDLAKLEPVVIPGAQANYWGVHGEINPEDTKRSDVLVLTDTDLLRDYLSVRNKLLQQGPYFDPSANLFTEYYELYMKLTGLSLNIPKEPQGVLVPGGQLIVVNESGQVQFLPSEGIVEIDESVFPVLEDLANAIQSGRPSNKLGAPLSKQLLVWEDGRAVLAPHGSDLPNLLIQGEPVDLQSVGTITSLDTTWQRVRGSAMHSLLGGGMSQLGSYPISRFGGATLPPGCRIRFGDFGRWVGGKTETRVVTIFQKGTNRFFAWDGHAPVGNTPHDVWHFNQKGMAALFGKTNHSSIPPAQLGQARFLRYVKYGGRTVLVVGIVTDGYALAESWSESIQQNSPRPVTAQAIRTVGGWGGAWAGFKLGVLAGGALGIETGPWAAVTAIVGGIICGFGGYYGADWVADMVYED